MAEPRTPPQQERGHDTLKLLRRAAIDVYNEIGRDALSTTLVAQHAHVSIGTVYRYWSDRIAILEDIAPERDKSGITIRNLGGQPMCEHGFPVQELCTTVQSLVQEDWEHHKTHHTHYLDSH